MRSRRIITMLILALLLCACASPGQEVTQSHNFIIDSAGRQVEVPESVDRIACLYAYAGHTTVLLGQQEKIVAVVNGLKRDVLMRRVLPEIDQMPTPYTSGAINVETLLMEKPDVSFVRLQNLQSEGEREKLERSGLTFVGVDFTTMAEQKDTIQYMGKILDAEERAQEYLAYYDKILSWIAERVKEIPEEQRPRVYHSVNEVARTDVKGSITDEMVKIAGIRNVIDEESSDIKLDGEKAFTTVEQIYKWDPDLILVNEPDAYRYFMEQDVFSGLRAVREQSVRQLPVGISRWGHPGSIETPIAALYIAKTVYPSLFEDVDMKEETREYYQRFFSLDLTDEEVEQILSGEGMRDAKE